MAPASGFIAAADAAFCIGRMPRRAPAGLHCHFIANREAPEGQDGNDNPVEVFALNRAGGAPWALAVEPGTFTDPILDFDLLFRWFDAVLAARLPEGTPPVALRPIEEASGWLGNRETFEIAAFAQYDGDPLQASRLPTMETAQDWQAFVTGGE